MEPEKNYLYKLFLMRWLPRSLKTTLHVIEVRRFSSNHYLDFDGLKEQFEHFFPSLTKTVYKLHWQDDDGDYIRVTSLSEIDHACELLGTSRPMKFFAVPQDKVRSIVHEVRCDGCGMDPIVGHRYECVQCDDYDLCRDCEHRGVHGEHDMRRHASDRMFLISKGQNPEPGPGSAAVPTPAAAAVPKPLPAGIQTPDPQPGPPAVRYSTGRSTAAAPPAVRPMIARSAVQAVRSWRNEEPGSKNDYKKTDAF